MLNLPHFKIKGAVPDTANYLYLLFVLCQDVSSCRQEILSVCDEDGDKVVTKREFIRHAMKSVFIRSIL